MAKGFKRRGKFIPIKKRFKKGSKVQSVVLDNKKFPTVMSAKAKVKQLGFKTSKVDKTTSTTRFRQIDPKKCIQGQFATIRLTEGVQAVICEPK